jgi:transcriptional regulator with XRE-family HTH domain
MILDKNLKRFMGHVQWTGNVLSRKSGIPASTLHQWMTGGSVRELRHLKRLCEVIGSELGRRITMDELVFEELSLDGISPEKSTLLEEALGGLLSRDADGWQSGSFEVEIRIRKSEKTRTRRK